MSLKFSNQAFRVDPPSKSAMPVFIHSPFRGAADEWPQLRLKSRSAAVAIVFDYGSDPIPDVFFILRSSKIGSHRGQVGFPGGMQEADDASPVDTAARETCEEIGIERDELEFMCWLPSRASKDGVPVIPVIFRSSLPSKRRFTLSEEVDELVRVPCLKLTQAFRDRFTFNFFGEWKQSDFYECDGHSLWGLSARIISGLDLKIADFSVR